MSLSDKVVLLTGACSGIGTATAEIFAKHGAKVVLVGRNVENLKAAQRTCESVNNKLDCLVIAGDVIENASNIIEQTLERFGRLDILVNYAGILAAGGIFDTDLSQFDHVLNTNLRGVFLLTRLATNHIVKCEGSIINVSNVPGNRPNPSSLSCSVSKAALDQFTQCVALELASHNVRVFGVDPGVVFSDLKKYGRPRNEESLIHSVRPKDAHFGSVDDVAKAIVFLAGADIS